jgi:D-glycero-D-manno-heptose 1,7-bisphosphate phosphatase
MPGLIYEASQCFDIDLGRSWLVGDKASDIQAGLAAGVKSILVLTGYGNNDRDLLGSDGIYVNDILAASDYIISNLI